MKTIDIPKKTTKASAAKAALPFVAPIKKLHVRVNDQTVYVIKREGNPEESRKLAAKIIAEAEKRTTGASARRLLSDIRNRRA